MAEKTVVDLVEEWQTGAGLVLGSAFGGLLATLVISRVTGPPVFNVLVGFLGGGILTFLLLSYLLYGR